jgi:hypothetical protein
VGGLGGSLEGVGKRDGLVEGEQDSDIVEEGGEVRGERFEREKVGL